jgi:putative ABC transport system permease protein
MIWGTDSKSGRSQDAISFPDFEDWKAQSRSFETVGGFTTRGVIFSSGGTAELMSAAQLTPGCFEMLGVPPVLGRPFLAAEQEPGASHPAVLGDAIWRTRFAGRPDVLGRTIRLNEENYTIVGVMPPGFVFPPGSASQVYTPLVRDDNRNHRFMLVVGRLQQSATPGQAQGAMDVIARGIARRYPDSDRDVGAYVQPLVDAVAGPVRQGLMMFLGVVGLVLLIACANVASLTLARGASRRHEMVIRATLGASRGRLVRQLLIESALLALAGGALGLIMAWWTSGILTTLLAKNFQVPRIDAAHIDGWVLGFTLLLSIATGLAFGVAPALAGATTDPNVRLREAARSATEGLRGRRVRESLVVAEMALAVVLLAGAGVLLRSLVILRQTAPGFRSERLAAVEFRLPRLKFAQAPARREFYRRALERVQAMPGVSSAALVADLPLGGGSDGMGFHVVGRPDPAPGRLFEASFNIVSARYFETMGIPVRLGREFTEGDDASAPHTIVVNDAAARRFWPGDSPLGKQISLPESGLFTVIGVTGDVRQTGLGDATRPEIDLCHLQEGLGWPWLVMVVRTEDEPGPMVGLLRQVARSIDPDVPVDRVMTVEDVLSASISRPRTYALLLAAFAALALALAAIGLYGVVSYTVAQRTHEMGIRIALGAKRSAIFRLALRGGLGLSIVGSTIGLAGGFALVRVLAHVLPEVQPGDLWTLGGIVLLLAAVVLTACIGPAHRATRVDPIVALRYE